MVMLSLLQIIIIVITLNSINVLIFVTLREAERLWSSLDTITNVNKVVGYWMVTLEKQVSPWVSLGFH